LGETVVCNTFDGIKFAVNSSDKVIGKSVFSTRRAYDCYNITNAFQALGIERTKILLDIGANIGTIGIYAVSQGLAKKCIAFEPEPRNFELLKTNVCLNGLSDQFTLHNVALSIDASTSITFELSNSNYGDHRVRVSEDQGILDEQGRSTIEVQCESLDNLIGADFAKDCVLFIDTQGFEGHVLTGGAGLVSRGVPLIMEFWPYGLRRANGLELLYSALAKSPYTTICDLRKPENRIDFSIAELQNIANALGEDGKYTDLLIF
jgi:FkbM family methyltransferase